MWGSSGNIFGAVVMVMRLLEKSTVEWTVLTSPPFKQHTNHVGRGFHHERQANRRGRAGELLRRSKPESSMAVEVEVLRAAFGAASAQPLIGKLLCFKLMTGGYVRMCAFPIPHACPWSRLGGQRLEGLFSPRSKKWKRGSSAFIFHSGPAYPWRQGVEFEPAAGSVGVAWTRAGGGGGCRRHREERSSLKWPPRYLLHVGGTLVAAPHRQDPPGRSEHDTGLVQGCLAELEKRERLNRSAACRRVPGKRWSCCYESCWGCHGYRSHQAVQQTAGSEQRRAEGLNARKHQTQILKYKEIPFGSFFILSFFHFWFFSAFHKCAVMHKYRHTHTCPWKKCISVCIYIYISIKHIYIIGKRKWWLMLLKQNCHSYLNVLSKSHWFTAWSLLVCPTRSQGSTPGTCVPCWLSGHGARGLVIAEIYANLLYCVQSYRCRFPVM